MWKGGLGMSVRCRRGGEKDLGGGGGGGGEGRAIQRRDSEDTGGIAQGDRQKRAWARERQGRTKKERGGGESGEGGGGGCHPRGRGTVAKREGPTPEKPTGR